MSERGSDGPSTALDLLKALAQVFPPTAVAGGVIDAIQEHRARKQLRLLEAVVADHDEALNELQAAASVERLVELIDSALRIAAEAHSDEKILLLADITAEGIRPDAPAERVDTGQYLIDVLAGLEAPDLSVLRTIAATREGTGQLAGMTVVGGLGRKELAQRLPGLGESLVVALARLSAAGLIANVGTGRMGGIGSVESYSATETGLWMVSALDRLKSG